jgi:hypothetical protein
MKVRYPKQHSNFRLEKYQMPEFQLFSTVGRSLSNKNFVASAEESHHK